MPPSPSAPSWVPEQPTPTPATPPSSLASTGAGSPCVGVGPYDVTFCPGDYAGGWSEWLQYAGPGQSVGVDPNMGANTWVSCTVYVNGRLDYADYASRGDGTDANCEWVMGPSYYPPSQLNRAV